MILNCLELDREVIFIKYIANVIPVIFDLV